MFVVSEDISAWSGPFYSAPDTLPYTRLNTTLIEDSWSILLLDINLSEFK